MNSLRTVQGAVRHHRAPVASNKPNYYCGAQSVHSTVGCLDHLIKVHTFMGQTQTAILCHQQNISQTLSKTEHKMQRSVCVCV